MDKFLKQDVTDRFTSLKAHKFAVIGLAVLVLLLFLIMQVRVGDKDNRIGDLQTKVNNQTQQINEFRSERKQFLLDAESNLDAQNSLADLQRTTVEWGKCLEDWGWQLTSGSGAANVTKVRCDTLLVEMNQKAGG